MKKIILAVLFCGILLSSQAHAGKFYLNGNYNAAGYSQSTGSVIASVPMSSRLGYGIGYLFNENDGPRLSATIFTSGTYDAVGGKANVDETVYDFSWLFALNPNWYWCLGAGLAPTKVYLQSNTNVNGNFGIGLFIGAGYKLNSNFFLEGQFRSDGSIQTSGLSSLAHYLTGFNLQAGYFF